MLSDLAINYIAKQSRGHLKEENMKMTLTELLLVSGLFWLVIIIGVIAGSIFLIKYFRGRS